MRNAKNLGANRNYNRTFALALGPYFRWHAHDDVCGPKYLELCLGVLENDPGVVGETFDQPNADTYARGRLFFDRAYTLKVAALWRPRDWSFGAVANYQDGQPFARMIVVTGLPQGAEAIAAFPRSLHRFTFTLTVDARAERALRVGKVLMAVAVEAFNLLDMKNEVEESVVSGPAFRRVTAIQPPRSVRLGLRLDV